MTKQAAFSTSLDVGTQQEETATVVGTITGDGNATFTATAAGMNGGVGVDVSVAVLTDDTPDTVATKARTALAADSDVGAFFDVLGSGDEVILRAKAAAANDATMNLAFDNDTCTGLTPDATSADTVAGVAAAALAQVQSIGGPGLALDTEDVTTHDQSTAWEENVATILRSGEVSLDIVYDPAGGTHDASTGLVYRMENKTFSYFVLTFPDTTEWIFSGFVTGFEPDAPHDGKLAAAVKLKITGEPTLA